MKTACAFMSLPPIFRTCPFLIIAIRLHLRRRFGIAAFLSTVIVRGFTV
jgi:hypothetical protein